MSEFANFMEYCIEKHPEGAYLRNRILLRIGCILVGLAILPVVTFSLAGKFFIAFVPVWMGLVGILYWYLSRFVNIEYEYRLMSGEFQMDVIYGQRQRRTLFTVRIRDMEVIRPYDEAHRAETEACDRVENCAISLKKPTPDIYYFIYTDPSGKRCAVLFEATRKAMEIMKFYNRAALTVKEDLRH